MEVTVLMSVYNTPIEQLKEAIESILNQTYSDFEFLIIDDCSKNGEIECIEQYKDERIRIIKNKENLGLERALNIGIKEAKGQYIIRMDSDDIAYPNRIEKQIEFMKKNPKYSVVGSRAEYIDENGVYGDSKKTGEVKKDDFLFGTPFIHPTLTIKKVAIIKIGGYPLYRRCEDYAMEMELYCNGNKGYIMSDILLQYRMDNNRV